METEAGTIGRGAQVHAFRVSGPYKAALCGTGFRNNGRPQTTRLTGGELSTVTCTKCRTKLEY